MNIIAWVCFAFAGLVVLINEIRLHKVREAVKTVLRNRDKLLSDYKHVVEILEDLVDAIDKTVDDDTKDRIDDAYIVNTYKREAKTQYESRAERETD